MEHSKPEFPQASTPQSGIVREEIPLACDLGAIDAESRTDHLARAGHLLRDVALERRETADGYLFRFAAEDYTRVVEFVGDERLCCPFLHFVLEVPPAQGALWLQIRGDAQARAFLRAELNLP
jgi:hypothetical protein